MLVLPSHSSIRRLLALCGLLGLLVLLPGCADLATLFVRPVDEGPPSRFVPPPPEPTYPPAMSTAARILERGEMVVGVRYDLEPFSYVTADSTLAGLEVDLARELARRWLGSPDAVRFSQVRSDTAFQYLEAGTVDVVLAGLLHTQDAEIYADFSPPYFSDGMAILTYPEGAIQSLPDLADRRVGTLAWTDSQAQLAASVTISPTYVSYAHYFDVLEALRTREIDAYVDQRHRLERARRHVPNTVIVGQWTREPFAMIYRQDDPFFANLVRLTFQDMAVDGTRDALYDRWLPGTSPPSIVFTPGAAPTPPLSSTPAQLSTLDVVGRIRDRGTVSVGYFRDRWPYSADRADGTPTGFEVRLLERMAELWLGSSAAVTFVPVTDEADALQRLDRGEVDLLLGNWVHTREAELRVDFSIPIIQDGVSILSLAAAAVNALPELAGRSVAVVVGSAAEAAAPELAQGVGLSALGYPDFDSALAALQGGEVAAVLTERRLALDLHFREAGFAVPPGRYTQRPVAYVLPEGDSQFRDLVNLTLMALEERGIYQELYELWFDEPIPALNTLPGRPAIPLVITP